MEEDSPDLAEAPLPEAAFANQGRRLGACIAQLEQKYSQPYKPIIITWDDKSPVSAELRPPCPACARKGVHGHGRKHTKACRQANDIFSFSTPDIPGSRWSALSNAELLQVMTEVTAELVGRQAAAGW